ncbi:MAG: hypothetical protein V4623_00340, partial [Pseudomonadota bacterium]
MLRLTEIRLPIEHAIDPLPAALSVAIAQRLGISPESLPVFTVFKRSHDARKNSRLMLSYTIDIALDAAQEAALLERAAAAGNTQIRPAPDTRYHFVAQAPVQLEQRPVVVGFGPCGIFAALVLAQMGFRPLVLERGKAVRERTQDTWRLWRKKQLNPESNVQFGEGGAGTFSDGKLYSQIKDPKHYGRKVLHEFVRAGAPEEILYVAKPHIGTFRLVGVVENMRRQIEALGGEIRFEQRVTGLRLKAHAKKEANDPAQTHKVCGVRLASGEEIDCAQLVLALGHSARDTFT